MAGMAPTSFPGKKPKKTLTTDRPNVLGDLAQQFHENLLGASAGGSQTASDALKTMQEQIAASGGLRTGLISSAQGQLNQGLAGTGDALLSRLVQSSTANIGKGLSDEERTRALQSLQQGIGAQTAARERLVAQQAGARGISGLAGLAPLGEATGAEALAKGTAQLENLNQQIKQQHFKEASQAMQLATQQDIADRQAKAQSIQTALQTLSITTPEAADIASAGIAIGNQMANFEILPAQMQAGFSSQVMQQIGDLEKLQFQLQAQGKLAAAQAAEQARSDMWAGLGSIAGSFIAKQMGSGSVS